MTGLSSSEAEKRHREGQGNVYPERTTRSVREIIQANTLTYFNLVNTVLFVLVLLTGEYKNGLFFMTIITNACIGITQEIRAKRILDRLSLLVRENIEVCRDDQWTAVPTDALVPGDHVRLRSGQQIPADGVMTDGYLEVNESMLTGESNTIFKRAGDKIYGGTDITSGTGEADLTAVGTACVSETIMADARKYHPAVSTLRQDMEKLIRVVARLIVPVGILLFLMQYKTIGLSWQEATIKTVSAVVGMIPEGLVVLTSIALAVSAVRLSRARALVQDLYSIESLARVDTICLDKTGTLTEGRMKVESIVPLEEIPENRIREIMGSYVRVFADGNMTDRALGACFAKNDIYEATDILPFSSERKYAAVTFGEEGTFYLGAPDFLFPEGRSSFAGLQQELSETGCRVLLLAHSPATECSPGLPADLEPAALIAIKDVLRENVKEILTYFKNQDITLKVISGDDPRTVSALAAEAGVEHADRYADMRENHYRDPAGLAESCAVFGRVLPEQKKAMIQALQAAGHTVAMVGDGVNDVPALKCADVGIAMAAGSSAAKNSANIVLLDSDFAVMPRIVNEGRRVINNIGRSSSMYLVKTFFSLLLSLYVILMQKDYPFLPVQLTIISAFGVGIPTFLLQFESSFERLRGRFFRRAFRAAVPSAMAVLVLTLICDYLRQVFAIPQARYSAVLIILTAYVYIYTLYRVYHPLTKIRAGVLGTMSMMLFLSLLRLDSILEVHLVWRDGLILIPALIGVPVIVASLSRIYDGVMKLSSDFFGKKQK